MEWIAIAIVGLLSVAASLYSDYQSKKSHEEDVEITKELQEDSQSFELQKMKLQEDLNVKNWMMQNEYNLPVNAYNRFRDAGFSENAAAQSVLGSTSTFSPIQGVSAGSNPIASIPMFANTMQGLQSWMDSASKATTALAGNEKTKQDIVFSKQMCEESKARISQIGQQIKASQSQIELAQRMTDSQIGLNATQAAKNIADSQLAMEKLNESIAQQGYLDAAAAEKLANASLLTEKVNTEKSVQSSNYANAALARAQGQYYETITEPTANMLNQQGNYYGSNAEYTGEKSIEQSMMNEARAARLSVSKALKVDIDSDLLTQCIMSVAQGDYETISKLLDVGQATDTKTAVGLNTYISKYQAHSRGKLQKKGYYEPRQYGSVSFTPTYENHYKFTQYR